MQILCLGLNHRTAPLSLRERLVFNEDAIRAALSRLGGGDGIGAIAEMVILSTCNRIEIYAASSRESFTELSALLSDAHGIAVNDLQPYLYRHAGAEAVRHLFNVAAGLDSLVLGEPQILGQVTRALELARGVGAAGGLLSRLFQAAIHAGKRARTETTISRNPSSVASLAASAAEKAIGNLENARALVLGAGEMAELTIEALRKRGVEKIRIINRTLARANRLAQRWSAESAAIESLIKSLAEADILIASTGASHTLVSAEMVRSVMAERQRALVLIDIAVPRDIEAACGKVPGVRLYDLDNLNAALETSLAERAAEVPKVEAILAEETEKFLDFLNSLEMLPLITDMRKQAEIIRRAELDKTLRRLPDLTESERTRIEALTMALVKKLLDNPTKCLRAEVSSPHAPEYAAVVRSLFGLECESRIYGFSGNSCSIPSAIDYPSP